MKKQLQEKLFRRYPKIFRQRTLPMTETCMCWGITTGDGWYDIIDNLCAKIQKICDNKPYQTEASQVKEKFGGLRFYTDHSSEEIEKLIEKAEQESLETCENCGSTKNVKQTTGWIYTLCEKCLTKRKKDDK